MIDIWCNGKEIVIQCCSCQKVRNDAGEWQDVKEIRQGENTLFSHSVCPMCLVDLYPELVSAINLTL